jgi:hypothetical protein
VQLFFQLTTLGLKRIINVVTDILGLLPDNTSQEISAMINKLINTNIKSSHVLLTPNEVKEKLPLNKTAEHTILKFRQEIEHILDFQDRRKFIVVGPCSIHDPKAAIEYGEKLHALAEKVQDKLLLIMRVYFEKPRTTVGWKGLINDPEMDDSFNVEKGILIARNLLLKFFKLFSYVPANDDVVVACGYGRARTSRSICIYTNKHITVSGCN